ncbi:hypothetical protein FQN50_010014, partial [Emmonsiellopsis sp. PD_5]
RPTRMANEESALANGPTALVMTNNDGLFITQLCIITQLIQETMKATLTDLGISNNSTEDHNEQEA